MTVIVDEEAMTVAERERFDTGRGAAALWAGVLLPPLGFLVAMEGAYLLVPWACQKGRHAVVSLGLIPGVLMLVVGALAAWRVRQAMGPGLGHHVGRAETGVALDPAPSRVRFLAAVGTLSGLLFVILLLSVVLPIAMLHPCD
jgi:hypothetical protein